MRLLKVMLMAQLIVSTAVAGDVIVTVRKSPENCAPLLVGVFTQETFLNDPSYKAKMDAAEGAVIRFTAIPAGRYAVSAFCDNNHNGELDKASFGRPIEPIGMSRNAKGHMGPPRFEEAAFLVSSDPVNISLTLR